VEALTADLQRLQDEYQRLQQDKSRGELDMAAKLRETLHDADMALADQRQKHAQQVASLEAVYASERADAEATAQQASVTAEERFATLQAAHIKLQNRFDAR
jgi:hypothetical protein